MLLTLFIIRPKILVSIKKKKEHKKVIDVIEHVDLPYPMENHFILQIKNPLLCFYSLLPGMQLKRWVSNMQNRFGILSIAVLSETY